MSTIVVVKKNGKACIAADTLTSFGDLRMGADYDVSHDKIQAYGEGYFGIVGSVPGFSGLGFTPFLVCRSTG